MQSKSIKFNAIIYTHSSMLIFDRGNDSNLHRILVDFQPSDDTVPLKTYSNLYNVHVKKRRIYL